MLGLLFHSYVPYNANKVNQDRAHVKYNVGGRQNAFGWPCALGLTLVFVFVR